VQLLPLVHEKAPKRISARVLFSSAGFLSAVICFLLAPSVSPLRAADEVGEILKQIKGEKSGAIKPDKPSSPTSASQASPRKNPKPQQASEKPEHQSANSARSQPKPTPFAMPIHGPKDKLPKQIRGHGLAGTFVIAGQFQGCLKLEALEDNTNPFCRTFIVANKRLNLPDDYFIPTHKRETLTISRSNPLIFLEKTSLAYYYVHMP